MNENKRLTSEELNAIRQRAENASPGPWYVGKSEDPFNYSIVEHYVGTKRDEYGAFAPPLSETDIEFIAHARKDVPALLAEVERLQDCEWALQFALDEIKRLQEGE